MCVHSGPKRAATPPTKGFLYYIIISPLWISPSDVSTPPPTKKKTFPPFFGIRYIQPAAQAATNFSVADPETPPKENDARGPSWVFKDYFNRHSNLRRHENLFPCRHQP